ncbi:transglutaminase-like domain-containing protein [Confluentibacter flavum]|uniref:Transglutaminase family protein n=1 Tax=Confluentibacter flavum TaxID=1909700 RepID=A0A2N3HFM9_9FLAO|nr:transglutaminase family protein [Confluentibacter flavum]PKQ43702.1 transglutaminase family protein [Confluentibacter flavum]
MTFNVNSSLSYVVNGPTTFIFNIQALNTNNQRVLEEKLEIEPQMNFEQYTSHDGNSRFIRLKVQQPTNFTLTYSAVVEMNYTIIDESNSAKTVPVVELDSYIASFLYPSRYCQSDQLMKFSFKEFGNYGSVYETVVAITDWIHANIEYTLGSTNSQTSAINTITERVGVCRDFAHLGMALCRALSIPARYFTGYAYQLNPQDFHACMEVYIDGNWIIFDSTKLAPLNGLVKISNGRDAADSAVASIFGNAIGTNVYVNCQVTGEYFEPFNYSNNQKGISFQ